MDFSHLPDEVMLKVLSHFTSEPDILLNITSLINKRFHRLSLDASLWRNFTVPNHWGTESIIKFLLLDSPSSHVQTLTCCQVLLKILLVYPDTIVGLVLPAIRELILQPESTIDEMREQRTLQQIQRMDNHEIDYIKAIPQVFPNLVRLSFRSHFLYQSRGVSQLQTLSSALPNIKLHVLNVKRDLLSSCKVVDKSQLQVGDADTMKWIVENVNPEEVSNIHIITHNDVSLELEPFVVLFGPVITIIRLFNISGNSLRLLTSKCENLKELNISLLPADCFWDIANNCKHLENLNVTDTVGKLPECFFPVMSELRSLNLPSVCAEDLPIIIKSCPNLTSIGLREPQSLCSLPATLCRLSVWPVDTHNSSSPLTGILHQSQKLPNLTTLVLNDVAMKYAANALECGKLTKGWSHITTVDLELPDEGHTNLVDFLKFLGLFGAPLRNITVQDEEDFSFLFDDVDNRMVSQSISPLKIFETLISFPGLQNLKLLLHCAANLHLCDLEVLAYACPLLQTFKLQANLPANMAEEEHSENLQWIKEILQLLTQFKRLSLFQLFSSEVIFQNPDDAEEKLNALYGSWMVVKVDTRATMITLSQCPPAYRSF